ncbi:GDSL-type esterase/lipase family protein [uncultured Phocaeicola sp.]|uniref:GDSL-type esterase/lipase family protein n=1 Tax=uncultured Phocaeicola sp. TaxID=990718 RepID=UPI0025F9F378|nr:GDSL-type esterase/lipase family protein [uncultured Phocaeicola sp.]
MKLKQLVFYIACLTALVAMPGYAQDVLPECPKPDKHSSPVYPSHEMKQLMQFVSVDSPMPAVFRNTTENELTDPAGSLNPFWEKLGALDRPLRIVHIGDSHVRGHVFPYVMRCSLEDDFGSKAVENIPVTYQTSGIARETGSNGVVYHILGVNGATCQSFSTPEHIRQIADLHPDLVILSFGTNEAHGRRYNASEHTAAMNYLIAELKASCPDVAFLMTTPPGAYVRNGRRGKIINPRTPLVVENELKFAREHGIAIWDMYDIVGGKQRACLNWNAANMYQRDKIHFTHEGYTLQGLLLYEAFIKAYNHYVATRLD